MVLFHDPIFDFLKVEESLRKDAFIYFAVYIMGLLPITLTNSGLYLMNAFGIGGYPFYMSLLSSVLNIAGNIASVVLLKWGIFAVALSSVLSAAVVDVFYAVKLKKCFKEMGVAEEKIGYSFSHVKSSFSYAMPNTSQQMIMYFSSFLISPFVNGMGVAASASYSVVSRLYDINAAVYQNSARCVSNYSAQCVGEKEYRKIKKGVFAGFLQGALLLLPFVLACAIFHKPICSLFFKAGESLEAKEYAYTFAKYYLPFIYINMVCNLFHALFRGVKAMRHLVISTLILSLSRYFVSLLLIPKWGMHGFFAGWVLSWAAEAIYAILIFFFGRWNPEKRNLKKSIDKAV
jgi:Na+-driven multidrug efflux pump